MRTALLEGRAIQDVWVVPPRGAQRQGDAAANTKSYGTTLRVFLPRVQPLVSALQTQLEPAGEAVIYLYGAAGSGKSHLLKMLAHLWVDTVFPDGSTARSLVPAMPDDLRSAFRELDTAVCFQFFAVDRQCEAGEKFDLLLCQIFNRANAIEPQTPLRIGIVKVSEDTRTVHGVSLSCGTN